MKKLQLLLIFISMVSCSLIGQVPYRQAVIYYNDVSFIKNPISPYATLPNGLLPLNQVQDTLSKYILKTGIKTVNGTALLGSGNIVVSGTIYAPPGIPVSTGTAWGTSLTDNSTNWNTAFGWGNHSTIGYVTGTPWTAMGYLTAQTSHADVLQDADFPTIGIMLRGATVGSYSVLANNSTNWNTAFGWGNHSLVGYLLGNGSAASLTNFPVFNQNTTGYSANLSGGLGGQILYQSSMNNTAKLANGIAGQILVSGGTTVAPAWANNTGGANSLGSYIVKTATNAPSNAQILGSMITGIMKSTTVSGNVTIAVPRVDYVAPADTIPLSNYISGIAGKLAVFRGDSSVIALTGGTVGQVPVMQANGTFAMGGGTLDSIRVLAAAPTKGNIYINSTNNKLYIKSGSYWRRPVWASDSISVGIGFTKTNIASYAFSNYSEFYDIGAINNDGAGTVFTAGSSGTLESIQLYMLKVGIPTGNAVIKLYSRGGVYGTTGVPTGALLATSDNFNVANLGSTYTTPEITFSGANKYNLVSGTEYAFMFDYTAGGNTTNYIQLGFDATAATYSGNIFAFDNSAYYPSGSSPYDLIFVIFANVSN